MADLENIESLKKLLGRPVISVETANKLGRVNDLLVEPLTGGLAGISVERPGETHALVSVIDVHGIGPDAIMVERDESLVSIGASPLNTIPKARANLLGVKIITEHGKLLGNISDLYLCLVKEPIFIYEVRSSILDKLLNRAFYFAASLGCAFAADRSALIVRGKTERLDHSLEGAATRLLGPFGVRPYQPAAFHVEVRSRAE